MIAVHLLARYWAWAGSNIGAMPGCGAVAIVFTMCFRKPVRAAWHRLVGDRADIEDIRHAAAAAHKIAADLFEHHTGEAHPDAPAAETESEGK